MSNYKLHKCVIGISLLILLLFTVYWKGFSDAKEEHKFLYPRCESNE